MIRVLLILLVAACEIIAARINLEASAEKLRQAWKDEHRQECLRRLQDRHAGIRLLEFKSGINRSIPQHKYVHI